MLPIVLSRRATLAVIGFLAVASCAGAILLHKERKRRELHQVVGGRTDGAVTYACARSDTVDFDPRHARRTELSLVVRRRPGEPATWQVQAPGAAAIPVATFPAASGSIGGSQGLRWREADGSTATAVIALSDLIGEFGPETIWLVRPPTDGVDPITLICGADPKSFRPN